MSTVPPAQAQVSEHPAGDAVTKPTDPKFKAADVDRKLRFIGVIQAFREGRYPDNKQIEETLDYVLSHSPVDLEKLSPEGKKLVGDVRDVITTAKEIVAQKNSDEELQNFLYHTRLTDYSAAKGGTVPVSKDERKSDATKAAESFRTLGKLLLTNAEARKLLEDAGIVGRDIFADTAVKAANAARPNQEHLDKVDEPAPADQFIDAPTFGKKKDKAAHAADETRAEALDAHQQVASTDPTKDTEAAREQSKKTAKEKMSALRDRIPEEHRNRVKDQFNKGKEYLKDKFPEERRDQFIFRLKKVIVEIQRHRDYQDAIDFFLTTAETYQGHAGALAGQGGDGVGAVRRDSNWAKAEGSFLTLIERFANGRPTKPIFEAIDQIYEDVKNDAELRQWFKDLDKYLRAILQEPGYVMRDEANVEARRLRDSGKLFFVTDKEGRPAKYKPHKDLLFDRIHTFFQGMAEDPLNVKFGEDWKRLTKDLFLDADGKPTFKPNLWQDIRSTILPSLLEHVGYIPIPRVEYSDKMIDLVIENLTLEGQNLMPNLFEIDQHSYFKLSPYSTLGDFQKHNFTISFSQVQADMRDVCFYFSKKSGFPKMRDSGVADVFLGGSGISARVELEAGSAPAGQKSRNIFVVKKTKAKVDKLTFAVRESKHNTLYKTLRPLAKSLIKKQIQKAVQDGLRTALENLNTQLVSIRDRMDEAAASEDRTRTDVVKEIFERKKSETGSKAPGTGTFKVVTDRRESMINEEHPDSWLKKLESRKSAVQEGEGWHSAAFTIVGENQPLPTPAKAG